MTQYKRESIPQLMRWLRHQIEEHETKRDENEKIVSADPSAKNIGRVATVRGALRAYKMMQKFAEDHFVVATEDEKS